MYELLAINAKWSGNRSFHKKNKEVIFYHVSDSFFNWYGNIVIRNHSRNFAIIYVFRNVIKPPYELASNVQLWE